MHDLDLLHYLHDVLVGKNVVSPDLLRLGAHAASPHPRVFELLNQLLVQLEGKEDDGRQNQ